jgi:glycosyltransferase involved in cell wall biosynthesis
MKKSADDHKYREMLIDGSERKMFLPEGPNRIGSGGRRYYGDIKEYEINKPVVTIITVVYNSQFLIEKTVESVLKQTYKNVELIVIDGGSTDRTLDIIKTYNSEITYWVSEPDKGIYDAMNKGIICSTGNWLNFMNSGDTFASNHVVYDLFKNNEDGLDMIYGDTFLYNKQLNKTRVQNAYNFTKINILKYGTRVVCHQSMFISENVINLYNTQYKLKAELDLYFNFIFMQIKILKVNSPISVFLEDGTGTQRYFENLKEKFYLIYRRCGLMGLFIHFPHTIHSVLAYYKHRIRNNLIKNTLH